MAKTMKGMLWFWTSEPVYWTLPFLKTPSSEIPDPTLGWLTGSQSHQLGSGSSSFKVSFSLLLN